MTALDFSNPVALMAEAKRRRERRAKGQSLTDDEPAAVAVSRWPVLAIELPRPTSLALEKLEQREIVRVFQRFGCRSESMSQARRSRVALGLPDLWVWFLPIGRAGYFEVKSGTDWRFSGPQLEWAEKCLLTNVLYGCGDRFAAAVFCRAIGLREQ